MRLPTALGNDGQAKTKKKKKKKKKHCKNNNETTQLATPNSSEKHK
jgi:hypothetical protein